MMKKYIGLSLVLSVSTLLMGSEEPNVVGKKSDKIATADKDAFSFLRSSTEALTIAVVNATTKEIRERNLEFFSSGSSPAGTGHLFPGQSGNSLHWHVLPIQSDDEHYLWKHSHK